jgi:hypothetical protein
MEKSAVFRLLEETIGIPIKILSNEYDEFPVSENQVNSYQKILFQVLEEEPDDCAIGILFTLSLMSFTYSASRGYSENLFVPDEEWSLEYFVDGLRFKRGAICFTSDYVSGRLMKTDIEFAPGGKVTLTTGNRARGAERWLLNLQGKKHIEAVK